MAPLPPSNTARMFVTYRTCEADHTFMCRFDPLSATGSEVVADISDFFEAMSAKVYNSVFVKAEASAEGSDVRLPVVWDGVTEWGTGAGDPQNAPYFWSFTGKDPSGRRMRYELFGRIPTLGEFWRLAAVDDTSVAAALAVIINESADFLSIAGNSPIMNQYANRSVAEHWIKELR